MSGIINSTGSKSGVIGTTVGSPPTNILQIKAVNGDSTDGSTTNTNFSSPTAMEDTGITINVSSASSRVLIQWLLNTHISASSSTPIAAIYAFRGSTNLGCIFGTRNNNSGGYFDKTTTTFIVDHPNTTGDVTYSLKCAVNNGTFYYNRIWVDDVDDNRQRIMAFELKSTTNHT